MVQGDDAEWYDENVPSSEGFRPRGEDDVVEGHISIEVHLLTTCRGTVASSNAYVSFDEGAVSDLCI